ncbi:hypothetical protein P5673_029341 [Acropora cervicornis]|uniref:Uncharacterized protein n=1 Tax=Acropora cervicornis TaxID=6130 RepID=A0AAD9UUH4_ACRCE|nr:hypothetical protein P5673_029341 [Acropora cervicornis]
MWRQWRSGDHRHILSNFLAIFSRLYVVGHGSNARAHKLSNAMEFNPVIPPRATQTYSMRKKYSQKSKTLCSGSFYNDIFLLLINKPVVLEKKGNGGKNT